VAGTKPATFTILSEENALKKLLCLSILCLLGFLPAALWAETVGIFNVKLIGAVPELVTVATVERAVRENLEKGGTWQVIGRDALLDRLKESKLDWQNLCLKDPLCLIEIGKMIKVGHLLSITIKYMETRKFLVQVEYFEVAKGKLANVTQKMVRGSGDVLEKAVRDLAAAVLIPRDTPLPQENVVAPVQAAPRATGTLVVETQPGGAKVMVNGILKGKTPLAIRDVALPEAQLKISKIGYRDLQRTVALKAGESVLIQETLAIGEANFQLNSDPTGAEIFLNGKSTGQKTPATLSNIPMGELDLCLKKEHYRDYTEKIVAVGGQDYSISPVLEGIPAKFTIETKPSGLDIYISGLHKGISPATLELEPGKYSLAVGQKGIRWIEQELTAVADTPAKISLTLSRESNKKYLDMVYVPAGSFLMGSTPENISKAVNSCQVCGANEYNQENPRHEVFLSAYYIDTYEVTNSNYNRCSAAKKCKISQYAKDPKYNGPNQPVVGVDWENARNYCQFVGKELPSEAQWEKAARGPDGRIYPWGNEEGCEYANYGRGESNECSETSQGKAMNVGSFPKGVSPYGAHDMAGNVWEWVNDYFAETYYQYSELKNPTGPALGISHCIRGGSWDDGPPEIRSARRGCNCNPQETNWHVLGFRCAAPPPALNR
jgi:formylglycine-generating enzyme required for sulfatase activity